MSVNQAKHTDPSVDHASKYAEASYNRGFWNGVHIAGYAVVALLVFSAALLMRGGCG